MLRFQPDHQYVLIEHGKHGRVTHAASTPKQFAASCYAILKQRVEDGCWYDLWDEPEKPAGMMTREEADALPEGPVRDAALGQISSYTRELREARANNELVERAKRIVAEPDTGPVEVRRRSNGHLLGWECEAGRVLNLRRHYEYEDVELSPLQLP